MLKIGLTGGIASGKSRTLSHLTELGAYPIDADELSRQVVEVGRPAYREIVTEFGEQVLGPSGELDRQALGSVVFSDSQKLHRLNQIVHPRVIEEEEAVLERLESQPLPNRPPVVIIDAALMVEVGTYRKYDLLLVTYCPPATQLNRLLRREGMTESEARDRIGSQMPLLEKVRYGDYVIETSGPVEETDAQIDHIYREILIRWGLNQSTESSLPAGQSIMSDRPQDS